MKNRMSNLALIVKHCTCTNSQVKVLHTCAFIPTFAVDTGQYF